MKNLLKTIGIIVLSMIIFFSFSACKDPDDDTTPGGGVVSGGKGTQLTLNTWANGNITSAGGEQWFWFTATENFHYIHFEPGTLTEVYVELYLLDVNTGLRSRLYGTGSNSWTQRGVAVGNAYSIKVTPYGSTATGTYKISYNNTSNFNPNEFPPQNPTELIFNDWVDGEDLETVPKQWFTFTATSGTQWFHYEGSTSNNSHFSLYSTSGVLIGGGHFYFTTSDYVPISRSVTVGQDYYIQIAEDGVFESKGTFKLSFKDNAYTVGEIFPPENPLPLTENEWEDGSIAAGQEEWFTFTATADLQYVHFDPVVLTQLRVELYNNQGSQIGNYYSTLGGSFPNYASFSVTEDQVYYIKVRATSNSYSGAYKIAFKRNDLPVTSSFPPETSTSLTLDTWSANANFTASTDIHWYNFTATAEAQYIHYSKGTTNRSQIQIYNSDGIPVGDSRISSSSYPIETFFRTLQIGQTYYIKVNPYSSPYGTYKIGFNEMPIEPDVTPTILSTANAWQNSNISVAYERKWFSFTATTTTQYIYYKNVDLGNVYIQLYDSTGSTTGNFNSTYSNQSFSYTSLISGQTYYIRVEGADDNTGDYNIAFSSYPFNPDVTFTALTFNTWTNSSIASAGDVQWFTFTATAETQYIHYENTGLGRADIQLYNSLGSTEGGVHYTSSTNNPDYFTRTLANEETYYIKVNAYTSSGTGGFKIGFTNTEFSPGAFPPQNPVELTEGVWGDGNITTEGGIQYFHFTATATTQYIHFNNTGTLTDIYIKLYNADNGTAIGTEANLYSTGSNARVSRSLVIGQSYFIRVRPSNSSNKGTFYLAFNSSTTVPVFNWTPSDNITPLTAGQWETGSIAAIGGEEWYSFQADAGKTYRVWLNHLNSGNYIMTQAISATAFNGDGTTRFNNVTSAWNSSTSSFTPTANGLIYIRITATGGLAGGTFSLVYTENASAKPDVTFDPPNVTALTLSQWGNGNIPNNGEIQWFSFTATTATNQYIHLKGGTLTNVYLRVFDNNGTQQGTSESNLYGAVGSSYTTRSSLTIGDTYYIRVRPNDSSGTYQIGYNASSTFVELPPASSTALTNRQWLDDEITSESNGEVWYTIQVTNGTSYYFWWNEAGTGANGDGTKTLDVTVIGYYSDGATALSSNTTGWQNPPLFNANRDGTVFIRVTPASSGTTGTFSIIYSTVLTERPIQLPDTSIVLLEDEWANGNIPNSGEVQWFSFTATDTKQYIHVTFGTLTNFYVRLYDSYGVPVGIETSMSSSSNYVERNVTSGGTYYIRVRPYGSSYSGTYKIAFNTSTTPPGP